MSEDVDTKWSAAGQAGVAANESGGGLSNGMVPSRRGPGLIGRLLEQVSQLGQAKEKEDERERLKRLEKQRKALYMAPQQGMDPGNAAKFQQRAAESKKPDEVKEEALASAYLESFLPESITGYTGIHLEGLKEGYAKDRWGHTGPVMSNQAFNAQVRADYELDDHLYAAARYAAQNDVNAKEAYAGWERRVREKHAGWHTEQADAYARRFTFVMQEAKMQAQQHGPGVYQVTPGWDVEELFAGPPQLKVLTDGSIGEKVGGKAVSRTVGHYADGMVTLKDMAARQGVLSLSGDKKVYLPNAELEAAQEDDKKVLGQTQRLRSMSGLTAYGGVLLSPEESIRAVNNPHGDRAERYAKDLATQRAEKEQHYLSEATHLATLRAALQAEFQEKSQKIEGLSDEGEKARQLAELRADYGKRNMALANERSGLLWQAREDAARGLMSLQDLRKTGRALNLYDGTEDLEAPPKVENSWDDADTQVARLRAIPGMGATADRLDKLNEEYRAEVKRSGESAALQERYRSARVSALEEGFKNRGEVWKELMKFREETRGEVQALGYAESLDRSRPDTPSRDEFDSEEEYKQAREKHEQIMAEYREKVALQRMGTSGGLLQRATERLAKYGVTEQEVTAMMKDISLTMDGWGDGFFKSADKTRVLSTGEIVVNPRLWVDPDGYRAAVEATDASAEAKRRALLPLDDLRKDAAADLINSLQPIRHIREVREWFDAHPGTVEEQAAALAKEQKGDVLAQAINRVNGAGAGIAQQGIGVLAAFTGMVKDSTGVSLGSDYLHEKMLYWQHRSAAWESLAQLGDTGVAGETATKILGGAASTLPSLAGGVLLKAAVAPFTRSQLVLRTAGMVGASGTAAAQSAAGMYSEVYAVNRQRGMPEEQARRTALKPALIAGVITAALSYRGGANGVEAFFREEGREVLKRSLWEHAKAMGRDITEEMLEEGADTFLQELTKMVHLYPDRSMRDILSVTLDGALTGGGVAGMMVGGKRVFGGGHGRGGPEGQPGGDGVPPYLSPEGGRMNGMALGQDLQLPSVRGQGGVTRAGEANPLGTGVMHNSLDNGGTDNGAATGAKPGDASVPGGEPLVPEMAGGPKVDEESGHAVPPGGGGGKMGLGAGDANSGMLPDNAPSTPTAGERISEASGSANDSARQNSMESLRTAEEASQAKSDAVLTPSERLSRAQSIVGKGLSIKQREALAYAAEIYDGSSGLSWKTTVQQAMHGPVATRRGVEAHKRELKRLSDALFNVLTPERRKAVVSKFLEQGKTREEAQKLVTAFHEQARKISEEASSLDQADIEHKIEEAYYKTFGDAAIPRTELDNAHPTYVARHAEREATRLYEEALKAAEGHPARDSMEKKAKKDFIDRLNNIKVGPTHFKWGNPKSQPTYRHAFIDHGRTTDTQSILDRTVTEGTQIGRYLDDDLGSAYVGAIAKLGPGLHDVPLPRGLHTEVALVDLSLTIGDMMRVIVADDGHVVASFPFRSDQPSIRPKRTK